MPRIPSEIEIANISLISITTWVQHQKRSASLSLMFRFDVEKMATICICTIIFKTESKTIDFESALKTTIFIGKVVLKWTICLCGDTEINSRQIMCEKCRYWTKLFQVVKFYFVCWRSLTTFCKFVSPLSMLNWFSLVKVRCKTTKKLKCPSVWIIGFKVVAKNII